MLAQVKVTWGVGLSTIAKLCSRRYMRLVPCGDVAEDAPLPRFPLEEEGVAPVDAAEGPARRHEDVAVGQRGHAVVVHGRRNVGQGGELMSRPCRFH